MTVSPLVVLVAGTVFLLVVALYAGKHRAERRGDHDDKTAHST